MVVPPSFLEAPTLSQDLPTSAWLVCPKEGTPLKSKTLMATEFAVLMEREHTLSSMAALKCHLEETLEVQRLTHLGTNAAAASAQLEKTH